MTYKKVNANDMLQMTRSYKALNLDVCILCMEHRESVDHLFLHCSLTMGCGIDYLDWLSWIGFLLEVFLI